MPPLVKSICVIIASLQMALVIPASSDDIFDLGFRKFEKRSDKALARGFEAIIEAHDGQIIIGGQVGLYSYAGDKLVAITLVNKEHEKKLSVTYIEKLRLDPSNRLWVFSKADGVFRIDLRTRKSDYFPPFENTKDQKVHVTDAYFSDKSITLITKQGPYDFELESRQYTAQKIYAPKLQDSSPAFTLVEPGVNSPMLLISAEHGLLNYSEQKWQQYSVSAEVHGALAEQNSVFALMDSNGSLWSTSHSGPIHHLQNGVLKKLDLPHEMAIHLLELDEEIWVPTLRNGILVLDKLSGELIEHIKSDQKIKNSLPEDDIVQLLVDRSGMLWVASKFNGLWVYNTKNKALRNLQMSDDPNIGLMSNRPIEVLERKNGDVWVIYIGNGIDVIRPSVGIVERFKIGEGNHGLDSSSAWLGESSDGTMVVGAIKSAPQIYDETTKTFSHIDSPSELAGKGSYVGVIDKQDRIIASYPEWYQYNLKTKQWSQLTTHSFDAEFKLGFGHFYSDKHGELWASDNTNIFSIDLNHRTVTKLKLQLESGDEPQTGSVYDFLEDEQDGLIVSSTIGFFRLVKSINSDTVQVSPLPLLADINTLGNISALHSWKDNLHWSSSLKYNSRTGATIVLDTAYGSAPGGIWYGRIIKTREGTLINPGTDGLILQKPDLFESWEYEPPLILTKRKIAGNDQAAPYGDIHVPADKNYFSVSFISLDYSKPNSSKYRYRLEGFEENWHLSDTNTKEATYTNIPPGQYTLNIQGSNRLGKWNSLDQRVNVYVQAAWYQQTWFYFLCGLITCFGVYLLVLARTKHLKQRERELSHQVKLRTQELEASLLELKQTQSALVESEKHASLGRLVYGLSHQVNTPLGIITMSQSMLGESIDSLQSNAEDKNTLKSLQRMSASIDLAQSNTKKVSKLMETFKQISTKEFNNEKASFNVGDTIAEAISISDLNKAEINYSVHCIKDILFISNQTVLRDVLKELIDNSIYHGFDGTENKDALIEIKVSLSSQLTISISDNGSGMNDEDSKHVFDPFFSADHKQDHIGLGLHIVFNKVTQLLGGNIQCRSVEGQGCEMILVIPN